MGKVQNFHGQSQISMAKNCMFSFSAHVFVVKIHCTLEDIVSWAKYNIFMGKLNCVLSPHACHHARASRYAKSGQGKKRDRLALFMCTTSD